MGLLLAGETINEKLVELGSTPEGREVINQIHDMASSLMETISEHPSLAPAEVFRAAQNLQDATRGFRPW